VKQKQIQGYTTKDGKRVHEADTGVGGMVKRSAGYDPTHGDWEYFYFEDPKKIESGRIASCVQCHSSAKDKDTYSEPGVRRATNPASPEYPESGRPGLVEFLDAPPRSRSSRGRGQSHRAADTVSGALDR
jgi:hypothetical protein